jgi:phospholipase C
VTTPAHVVVLMLENRSFDHMLGFLDHPGLDRLDETRDSNERADGQQVFVHRLTGHHDVSHDPGHGYQDVMSQLTGTLFHLGDPYKKPDGTRIPMTNGGFVRNYDRRLPVDAPPGQSFEIMGCWDPRAVPVISALAREFAVCSKWHAALPSETWPNRMFAHAGHSDGLLDNKIKLYDLPTIFGLLSDRRVSWRIYFDDVAQVASFWETHRLFHHNFSPFGAFLQDARNGKLPQYSWIEPRHLLDGNSQHPRQPVWRGEELLEEVYRAVSSGKAWNDTLLLITYDEHGGFYDREPPEDAVPPHPDRRYKHNFEFDMLGPRVPAIVVSPFVAAGTVDAQVRDHTCIPSSVRDAFGLAGDAGRLGDREAQAESVLGLLTLSEPRSADSIHIPKAFTPDQPLPEDATPVRTFRKDLGRGDVELYDIQRDLLAVAEAYDAAPPSTEPDPAGTDAELRDAVEKLPPPNPIQDEETLKERIAAFKGMTAAEGDTAP